MVWIFAGVVLSAALIATLVQNMRQSILALWVAGLGVGGMYLTMEAEFLAIIQWIVSTLVTITFIFFSVMFGEFGRLERSRTRKEWALTVFSILIGMGFAGVIGLGTSASDKNTLHFGNDSMGLKGLGQVLVEKNFISLEVLALTLFLVLVGGGVIARFDKHEENGGHNTI